MIPPKPDSNPIRLLYHFSRFQFPQLQMTLAAYEGHLERASNLLSGKREKKHQEHSWREFLENLHVLDFFLACVCLEGQSAAWEALFAARASRSDLLLVDALRGRAVRLFPRNPSKQEQAVSEFWGYLLAGEREGSLPILARYDGQRPLVPWLIRVFQNKHLSDLRPGHQLLQIAEDFEDQFVAKPVSSDEHWHEEFRHAAQEWLAELDENQILLLGLRIRYRMSQRTVADLLRIHEGNISRRTDRLREQALVRIGQRMQELGWTGENLDEFITKEMDSLLLDDSRFSANRLAALLAARGLSIPSSASAPNSL